MKVCAACHTDLPKDSYSKKQWKLDQRRCKVCITNNREVQPPPQLDNNTNTIEIINSLDSMYLDKATENSDEELFKQPPTAEDCPICFLRLPTLNTGRRYQTCCGKEICSGCAHASVYDDQGNEVDNEKCPFCRTPDPTSEEIIKRIKKRVKLNDAYAIHSLGCKYRDGTNGFPQHYKKAFELYHRAGELGYANAYSSIGYAYNNGQGVEVDKKKAVHYTELAAIGGCAKARYNLAIWEEHEVARKNLGNDELCEDKGGEREITAHTTRVDNFDRASKHYMIAVRGGHAKSLNVIKEMYSCGHATKEDYTKSLQLYQAYLGEIKSQQRDEAAAFSKEYRYY